MTYLLNEILLYLLAAAALGVSIGWFIRRSTCVRDLKAMQTKLDASQKELDNKTAKFNAYKSKFIDLRSEHELQSGDLALMTSRWNSTLSQAKQLPKYQTWLNKVQSLYQKTRMERDGFMTSADQYKGLYADANQKIKRLNKRVTDQETYKFQLGDMINKVRRLNNKVTNSENNIHGLYGMVAQVQSKWRNDRIDAAHLRAIHPQMEEEKNKAQWRLAEQDKKHTEQIQAQQERHQSDMESIQKRIDELTPLEGNEPGQDTKFNRFMDKIRLAGTSKNTVLGRVYKQIGETKREAGEKERVFVDTCEEKDAIIDDLREQVRSADNRAQAANSASLQESNAKVTELETKLKSSNSSITMLHEHELTIEAYKNKLAQQPTPHLKITTPAKPAPTKKQAKNKTTAKPTSRLKAPAKGLKIAAAKVKDNLQLIKGIGPVMEKKLNDFGVYSFEQLGRLTTLNIDALTETLASFPGRIQRDKWVSQSKQQYKKKYGKAIA